MQDELRVRILTPEEVLWDGYAQSISSKNTEGDFDILPEHANFFSLIEGKPIVVRREAEDKKFEFDKPALIHVQEDTVSIYANVGSSVEGAEEKNSS